MDNKTIVGYPLNGVYYSAEDAQTYLCTRTSGIYSSADNFGFGGVVNNRYVVIQPGLAWMKVSQFGGISFALKEAVQVYVEGGGDTDRTDLIVLRYDGNRNECSVACKKDSISVERDNNIFELGLYKVFVEAGSTQIIGLENDVQDVRLTELCGVMKDGVTGIPVENLVKDFEIQVQKSIDEFNSKANKSISDANDEFSNVASDGMAIVQELTETEDDYNAAVNAANAATNKFLTTDAPNAIASFGNQGIQAIATFNTNAQNAIEGFEEDVANIAAGTDVMLQTAFNPKRKVGQVAFSDEVLSSETFNPDNKTGQIAFAEDVRVKYINAAYILKTHSGFQHAIYVHMPSKQQFLTMIKNGKIPVIRAFQARQAGDMMTTLEQRDVERYLVDGEGNFDELFLPESRTIDFQFCEMFTKPADAFFDEQLTLVFYARLNSVYTDISVTPQANSASMTFLMNTN